MLYGELNDPYSEFFIRKSGEANGEVKHGSDMVS